ncbi:hypothetical protein [Sporosarcina globispora]|uniref:hypothetical protein n=1 Tax=Sporosarcina globispora TaxID=1459 RepID=UPI001F19D791|nr:hypothetical protein [Sporosarcina globispora]
MEETVVVEDKNTTSADILKLADGFLGAAYDEKEVTEVKMFQSVEQAKEYFESLKSIIDLHRRKVYYSFWTIHHNGRHLH